LFGGYSFNEHLGIELAWFDGGHMEQAQRSSPSHVGQLAAGGPILVDVDVSGFNAQAIGHLSLENGFALFGKFGVARLALDALARTANRVLASIDETEETISYGVGAERNFGRFGVRLELDFVEGVVRRIQPAVRRRPIPVLIKTSCAPLRERAASQSPHDSSTFSRIALSPSTHKARMACPARRVPRRITQGRVDRIEQPASFATAADPSPSSSTGS
jgi:OmpA-like transmembrane domain